MADRTQKCSTCRFWVRDQYSDEGQGVCRRYPRVSLYAPDTVDNDLGIQSVLPLVWEHDWCGEWQAARPEAVDDAAAVMARAVLAEDTSAARQLADKLIELIPSPVPGPATAVHDRDANDTPGDPAATPKPQTP